MKEIKIIHGKNITLIAPTEPIDENEPICLSQYITLQNDEKIRDYSKARRFGEDNFKLKIGGTTYDVSTHFNPSGKQCVLEQFKKLILSENLI